MSDRAVKIALVVSLLGNAFLAVAMAVGGFLIITDLNEQRQFVRQKTPLAIIARDLDEGERDQLRQHMRQVALTAAADMREAHDARKHAADLAGAPNFDKATIAADLDKARVAENRTRTHLENGLLDFMESKPQATRAVLAKMLLGRGSMRMGGPGHGPPPGGPPPLGADSGAPSPPPQ
jgi:uncharacterized membrane protein